MCAARFTHLRITNFAMSLQTLSSSKLTLALFVLFVTACDRSPVLEPPLSHAVNFAEMQSYLQPGPWTLDDEFARIARDEIPGFAGYYFDGSHTLQVNLKDLRQQGRAAEVLGRLAQRHTGPQSKQFSFSMKEVQFDFEELKGWRDRARSLIGIPGMVSLGIDEVNNQLQVGVLRGADRRLIVRALAKLEVPLHAVSFQQSEPIQAQPFVVPIDGQEPDPNEGSSCFGYNSTLRDCIRPIRAGLSLPSSMTRIPTMRIWISAQLGF